MEVVIVFIAVAVFIVCMAILQPAPERPAVAVEPPAPDPVFDSYIDNIKGGSITLQDIAESCGVRAADANIKMKRGEHILFHQRGSTIQQVRSRTRYKSGSAGTRVRVAKGISFNVGGTSGSSYSTTELETLGAGNITVTTDRLIVDGLDKPLVMRHASIVSYDHRGSAVEISNTKTRYIIQLSSFNDARLIEAILDVV